MNITKAKNTYHNIEETPVTLQDMFKAVGVDIELDDTVEISIFSTIEGFSKFHCLAQGEFSTLFDTTYESDRITLTYSDITLLFDNIWSLL